MSSLESFGKKFAAVAYTAASLFITTGLAPTQDVFDSTQDVFDSTHTRFEKRWSLENSATKEVIVSDSVAQKLPWLSKFYQNAKSANTASEVLPAISGIKQLFAEKQYDLVSDILLEMEINKLSPTAMVAMISAAYPARHKLDSWSLGVAKVKIALASNGLEPDQILKGLI